MTHFLPYRGPKNHLRVLPGVGQITLRGREFIVVLYEEWKQRVIARQTEEANRCLKG